MAGGSILETEVRTAARMRDGVPVLVLMHGRGAAPSDLVGLGSWLPEDVAVVFPRAPYEAAPWGYGPGWAWYRFEGGARPEPESFRGAQAELGSLLEALPDRLGVEPGAVVLGGFSQGGTMSLGYALRRPGEVAGVLNFSGFVPEHPDVTVTPATAGGTPIFWGHGTADPAIPIALAERGRAALRTAGAALEARDYAMGHGITPSEVKDAVAWLEGLLG